MTSISNGESGASVRAKINSLLANYDQTAADVVSAEAAKTAAETARDAAFVNADVYADIATGRAAVADGEQFQVVSGDEIIRYRRDSSSTQTEVARYQSAAAFLEDGKNLFDKTAMLADSGQGTGNVIAAVGNQLSDFIPITPGVTYSYQNADGLGARFRAVFTSSLVNRGSPNSTNTDGSTSYTAVSGDAFMRLTVADARVDTFQVEASATPTFYEPFGVKLTSNVLNAAQASGWAGRAFLSYGDSLTSQNEWQPTVAIHLGLLHTAAGVGGRRISGASGMWVQATIDALPASQDLIIVLGGTNDWSASVPIGELFTAGTSGGLPTITLNTNTNEFLGAVNVMVERLQVKYPSGRICLAAPPWSELPDRVSTTTWAQDSVNLQGLTINDYGDAIASAAKYWNLPFVDFREAGINAANNETFMKDDGGWLHPNSNEGGPRIAEVAIGRLKALEPVA